MNVEVCTVIGWKPEELDSFSILPSSGDCSGDQMRERKKKRFYYFHTNALLKLFPINLTYTNTIFIVLINKTYLFPLASTIHRNPFYKENLIQYLTKKLYKLKTLSEIHLFFSNLLLQKSVRKNIATFRNIVSSLIRF